MPEDHLPDALRGVHFYRPSQSGFEEHLSKRFAELRRKVGPARETGEEPPGNSDPSED